MKKTVSLLLILALLISTFTLVSAESLTYETIMHNIASRIQNDDILNDASMEWYIADLASYNAAFTDSQNLISEDLKVQFTDALIDKAEEKNAPGDLAKIIISLRALGIDARKLYNSDGEQIDAVQKLTNLIDNRDASVINEYTLPYVIIALNQGENYASQEQINYLLTSAINTQDTWKNLSWGYPDAATPMIFALSPYYNSNDEIKTAVDFAVETVKGCIDETGVAASNASSTGLVVVAFSAMETDSTCVEINENSINVIDGLLTFATENGDGFKYGEEESSFSTEQSFRGLVSYELLKNGKKLYDFYNYPMEEARKTATETCTVTFNITPSDAVLTVENAAPVLENTYNLTEGIYNYSVSKEGYITKTDALTITSDDVLSGTKNISIVLEEIEMSEPVIPSAPSFHVQIKVMAHNENVCNNSFSYKQNASEYTEVVNEELYLTESNSVLDILIKALRKNNISYTENNGYVSSINGISEFDHGRNSGWMFKVNGLYQNKGAQDINISSNATIVWFYTDDYTREKGSENYKPSSSGGVSKNETVKPSTDTDIEKTLKSVLEYLKEAVKEPTFSATGGEWTVLSLARSNLETDKEYFNSYIQNLKDYLDKNKGILSENKYTEYARCVIALTASGISAKNFYGHYLIDKVCDFESVTNQGINGAVWALTALNSVGDDNEETKEKYINYILSKQNSDGGWSLNAENTSSDTDITAMALTSLSVYQNEKEVLTAIENALTYLSEHQNNNGGFTTYGEETPESSAQVLVALSSLGIDCTDKRFVKNNKTIIDSILSFYIEGEGFSHEKSPLKTNLMSTEQCAYALVAYERFKNGKATLFDMSDAPQRNLTELIDFPNRHKDIIIPVLTSPGKTFHDISESEHKEAINTLTEYGIIHGVSEDLFAPFETMTRAEFAAITVKALSLPMKDEKIFDDVNSDEWFYGYINTAYTYGIVKGVSEKEFNPNALITKSEVAVMLERVAILCGMKNELSKDGAKDILCIFTDYTQIPKWAFISFAFCCDTKIFDDDSLISDHGKAVTREEIAQGLYNMLKVCKLL